MKTVTILLIHHEDPAPVALGSTWLFSGDGRDSMLKGVENMRGWVKIIGPTDLRVSSEVKDALAKFFKANGAAVMLEAISD